MGDWDFPDGHIEIASNLVIGLPILVKKYPDAFWVHLWRAKEPCVNSLRNSAGEAMRWFANQFWYFPGKTARGAEAFYDFCNEQISYYLEDIREERKMKIQLKDGGLKWRTFWDAIGAEGDFDKSQSVWGRRYNSARKRGRDVFEENK